MSGLLGYFLLAGSARASNSSFNKSRVFGALESDRRPELADGLAAEICPDNRDQLTGPSQRDRTREGLPPQPGDPAVSCVLNQRTQLTLGRARFMVRP
jgi:hypothetical protein